jgi:O-acetyl-ADP-ribose deacetylase (regulator of RNase III)
MGIWYVRGDLLASSADFLVIPVNCRGVAGRGLALQCKQRYPGWFEDYQCACRMGHLGIGRITYYVEERGQWCGRRFINLATKEDWRVPSRLQYIQAGLVATVDFLKRRGVVKRVAFPMLGCGAGGLDWEDVRPVMERCLDGLACCVDIYVG